MIIIRKNKLNLQQNELRLSAPSKAAVLNTAKKLNDLQQKKAALVKESDALKKRRFTGVKKNAVEVLNNFILVLELTTNKLIKDFNKDLVRVAIK